MKCEMCKKNTNLLVTFDNKKKMYLCDNCIKRQTIRKVEKIEKFNDTVECNEFNDILEKL